MAERVLITGGAGFIGRRVTDALLEAGHEVRVLDALIGQVHSRPVALSPEVDLVVGDVQDPEAVARALDGVDSIVHLAAEVGVGQSMYDVTRYVGANDLGTAVLLEQAVKRPIPGVAGGVFNVGSGRDVSIAEVGREIARAMGRPDLEPEITGKARAGDIRNCFADVSAARDRLGFEAGTVFPDGLDRLAAWLEGRTAADRTADAQRELEMRGLVA